MAKMNSKFKYMYDAAPTIAIIPKGAAQTATFNGPVHTLDKLKGWWNTQNELADGVFAIAVNVDALDFTTGDESYTIELEFGTAGFASTVKTHKIVVKAAGQYVFLVDTDTVAALLPNVVAARAAVTLAGTTPSFKGYAWMAGAIIDGR